MKSCLTFSQLPKLDGLKLKLAEFNGQLPEGKRFSEQEINRLTELPNAGNVNKSTVITYIKAERLRLETFF
jgi:hypothetical protein